MEYYSIKMRSCKNSLEESSEINEIHISGAERIVQKNSLESVCSAMVHRALTHSKGDPDKINIKIEKFDEKELLILKALSVTEIQVDTAEQGLKKAFELIESISKQKISIYNKLTSLLKETYPMRGAMLYDVATNTRMEPDLKRGIRATYMDALGSHDVNSQKNHFNEAIVLATKVAYAPGIIGEFCISDDPNYVIGYVSSKEIGYVRISKLKEMGDENGGRIFLFDSTKASVTDCINFLEKTKVLVECG